MKKLVIVYNPRSSKYGKVRTEVLDAARKLKGWAVGKYEVQPGSVDKNAKDLAKIISDGDLVVAAGGDGTATIALNGIMLSKKDAEIAVLPYGNFNDFAKTFNVKNLDDAIKAETIEIWPIEAKIDGKHWRYAAGYFTLGLFAESCEVFDHEKTRKTLQKGNKTNVYSWITLAKWYFDNRKKRVFLPKFKLNGKRMSKKTTDLVAINGKRMAGVMRGGDWCLDEKKFNLATAELRSFGNLFALMARSILWRVPGETVDEAVIEFEKLADFEIQAEGEYMRFSGVEKVEIRKAKRCLKVRNC